MPGNGSALTRLTLCGLVAGCSWGRFDELKREAPVVLLDRAESASPFGSGLAAVSSDQQSRLLVSGSGRGQGAAVYDAGWIARPQAEPLDLGHCGVEDSCFLAQRTAALERSPFDTEARRCFASGIATDEDGTGVLLRCELEEGGHERLLTLPARLVAPAVALIEADEVGDVALVSDPGAALLVGIWPGEQAVFYYPPGERQGVELELPTALDPTSLSGSAAVLATPSGHLLALGAGPSQVWLFRLNEADAAPVGCLAGPPGLGRALTAGHVDRDALEDLVVSDDRFVTVFSGAALAGLPATANPTCTLSALPESGVLTSFGCGEVPAIGACEESGFGEALVVGDVDGDGDGEVAVAAPRISVRGEARAGAVLVYDAEPEHADPSDVLFLSSAQRDDVLGSSLAAVRVEGRHVIAAGAPGAGETALFLCSAMLSSDVARACP